MERKMVFGSSVQCTHTNNMKEGTKLQKKMKKRNANAFKRFTIISTFIFMKFVYVCQPKRQKKHTKTNKYLYVMCIVHTKMEKK